MPTVRTPEFYPERLEQAVKARSLTWKSLADFADIRANTLSDYKNGKAKPSPGQLHKLAEVLDFPEAYFYTPPALGSKLIGPRLFRAPTSNTQKAANEAEVRLAWLSECLTYADKWLTTPQPEFLKPYRALNDPLTLDFKQIESIALSIRKKLGYGPGPITNLVIKLEKAGIAILRFEGLSNSKSKIDGLSQHSEIGRPLCAVFARSEPVHVREKFSICHELGHIVLHSNINENRFSSLADAKIIEDQANRFASSFLLPSQTFLNDIYTPTLLALEYLKRKWHVSIAAMIKRCYDLGHIDKVKYSSLNVMLSRKRWRMREPIDDVFEIERPILLKRVFETLSQREGISGDIIAHELALNLRDLASISGLLPQFFMGIDRESNIFEFPGVG